MALRRQELKAFALGERDFERPLYLELDGQQWKTLRLSAFQSLRIF